MKTLVIYHAGCWDGFCGAWLFHSAFPDAEFHPAHYGTEPPEVASDRNTRLFIVDFSYPRDVMFRLAALRHEEMVVLDHHKTAEAALEGIEADLASHGCGDALTVHFDMEKSGGRLAWEYLNSRKLFADGHELQTEPWMVGYTEDRDLWWHKLWKSKEVNAALRSYPFDFKVWDGLALCEPSDLAIEGDGILRYQDTVVADHVRNASEIDLDGHKVLAVNATTMFSEIAGELAKDRPFGVAWFVRKDGKRQWSLRSRDGGVDVSEIAKAHGGGGHKNAAGFESEATA